MPLRKRIRHNGLKTETVPCEGCSDGGMGIHSLAAAKCSSSSSTRDATALCEAESSRRRGNWLGPPRDNSKRGRRHGTALASTTLTVGSNVSAAAHRRYMFLLPKGLPLASNDKQQQRLRTLIPQFDVHPFAHLPF